MKSRLLRQLSISDTEWPRLLSMGCLLFLLMLGWGFGGVARGAYFVKEVGFEKLPLMYIITAASIIVVSPVYARLVDRLSRFRFFVIQLVCFGVSLILLTIAIPRNYAWTPYAIYAFSEIIVVMLVFTHFWTLEEIASQYQDKSRNASPIRCFG